ncbi:MAG: carboxypeptidase regulatory-like domain-containing protein [Armatimonadetes bacterium]|nr:carboxypeptidase regulatory-like domain-containing protein [Armatimonadota bacterium]
MADAIDGLQGVVRDKVGRPVPGATVRVRMSPKFAVTDGYGHYRFKESLRKGSLICAITSDSESGEPVQVWSHIANDLVLDKKATILKGRFLRRDGSPATGVTVVVRAKEKDSCTRFFNVAQVKTDTDGTYSCPLPFSKLVHFVFVQTPRQWWNEEEMLIERTEQTYIFRDVQYAGS